MTPKEKSRLFFSSAIVAVALIIIVVHFVDAPPPVADDNFVQGKQGDETPDNFSMGVYYNDKSELIWQTDGPSFPVKLIPPILPVRADQPYDPYTKFVKPLLTSDDAKLEVPYRRHE